MYKNACRFMQRTALHIRLHEANRFYFEPEHERPLRVGRVRSQQGSERLSGNSDCWETAMAHAMSAAGIKLR